MDVPFRLPVQIVNRPDHAFRGYSGTVTGGSVSVGDEVVAALSGKSSRVKRIIGAAEENGLQLLSSMPYYRGDEY